MVYVLHDIHFEDILNYGNVLLKYAPVWFDVF